MLGVSAGVGSVWARRVSVLVVVVLAVVSLVFVLPASSTPTAGTETTTSAASAVAGSEDSVSVSNEDPGVLETTTTAPTSGPAESESGAEVVSGGRADVRVYLDVPRSASGRDAFAYTATVTNQGPDAADGTVFEVSFEPGTTDITLECTPPAENTTPPTTPTTSATGGDAITPSAPSSESPATESNAPGDATSGSAESTPAPGEASFASGESAAGSTPGGSAPAGGWVAASCPSDVVLPSAASSSEYPRVTGRIDSLPKNGKVVFTLKGKFPNSSSATTVFSATLPEGMTDKNPNSNRIQQQTALTTHSLSVRVSKVQDRDRVVFGEPITYTLTFENVDDVPAKVYIGDYYKFSYKSTNRSLYLPFEYSYACDQNSSTMTCDPNWSHKGSTTYDFDTFWSYDVVIPVGQKLVFTASFTFTETCLRDAAEINVYNKAYANPSERYAVFADGSTEIKSEVNATLNVQCVDVSLRSVLSDQRPRVGERVRFVVDVSNSVGLAEDTPFEVQLPVDSWDGVVSNVLSVDPAQDVSCEVLTGGGVCPSGFTYDAASNTIRGVIPSLPKDASVRVSVDALLTDAAKFKETYRVFAHTPGIVGDRNLGAEGANRASTTFSWVDVVDLPKVPSLQEVNVESPFPCVEPDGQGGFAWVSPTVGISRWETHKYVWEINAEGHLVATTQPGYVFPGGITTHDYGVAGQYPDLTCRQAPEGAVTRIPVPEAPGVEDPCGAGNATWVKPEDTDQLWWEITGEGHLVVHAQKGYVFEGGADSHDFGVAVDSGQLCHVPGIAIPMTGGKAADTIYAIALMLTVVATGGAIAKRHHNTRARTYTPTH